MPTDRIDYGALTVVRADPQCHGRAILVGNPCEGDVAFLIVDQATGKTAGYYCEKHAHVIAQARAVSTHIAQAFDYPSTGKPERVTLILGDGSQGDARPVARSASGARMCMPCLRGDHDHCNAQRGLPCDCEGDCDG